jgi:hypothetical protein
MLPSARRLGVDTAGQHDGVQDQPRGEGRDPSKRGDNILAAAQHQAAVDHDPEEFTVGLHDTSCIHGQPDQPANRSGPGR